MEKIALNFVPLKEQNFKILIYRKKRIGNERSNDKSIASYNLSETNNPEYFWVSFEPIEGFKIFECNSKCNIHLSKAYIFHCLGKRCLEIIKEKDTFSIQGGFVKQLKFILSVFPEGNQIVWLSPYYLAHTKQLGFLLDFKFDVKKDQIFNRKIQQLSLSLDSQNHPNASIYFDKYGKLKDFLKKYYHSVFKGNMIDFGGFAQLPITELKQKKYIFKNNTEAISPFVGLNRIGAHESIDMPAVFYFYRAEAERDKAALFYRALIGEEFKNDKYYKGFTQTYGVELSTSNIRGINADNFRDRTELIELAKQLKIKHEAQRVIIFAFSPKKTLQGVEHERYLSVKYAFSQAEIPVQFVQYGTLTNSYALKSALSNLALGIFAKLGGKPWKMKPENNNCLVIGIGQTYHSDFDTKLAKYIVKKYVAYSVLLDTEGIYKSLEVLSIEQEWHAYIQQLEAQLISVLSKATQEKNHKKIAIHVPFRMKKKEVNTIVSAVNKIEPNVEIVVMRINTMNHFWGYDQSKVHLTVTTDNYIPLSDTEFLLWLDGIKKGEHEPTKRYAAPIYIDFAYANKPLETIDKKSYIQDLFNLSGANWRGLNAKATPVSIYYCKLVADYIKNFKETLHIEEIHNKFQNPWFL